LDTEEMSTFRKPCESGCGFVSDSTWWRAALWVLLFQFHFHVYLLNVFNIKLFLLYFRAYLVIQNMPTHDGHLLLVCVCVCV